MGKGNFKNNKLYGKSEIRYYNGNLKYRGNLKIESDDDNNVNYGTYFTDENIFVSKYLVFSGCGVLYYENGQVRYSGNFVDGKYEGNGKEYYPNGILKYEGQFKKGRENI